jgi:hypothetical protein
MKVRLLCMLAVAAVAVPVTAATVASGSSKKTYKVNTKAVGPAKVAGDTITGKLKGKPFGTCKQVNKIVAPNLFFKWTCKKGTVKGKIHVTTPLGQDDVKATVKWTGGTGKYKGAKGSGKLVQKISTNKQVITGKIKY